MKKFISKKLVNDDGFVKETFNEGGSSSDSPAAAAKENYALNESRMSLR